MMKKRTKIPLVAGVLAAVALAATAAFSLTNVSTRTGDYDGRDTGDVLVGDSVVFSLRTSGDGLSAVDRAQAAADELRRLPEEQAAPDQVSVKAVGEDQGIYVGETLIVSVSAMEARSHQTDRTALAKLWSDNLARALGDSQGEAVPVRTERRDDQAQPRGDGDRALRPDEGADWHSAKQKWVPIISLGQEGLRAGAAQIAGPSRQVDRVKAVAQIRLDYKGIARIYAYVPTSSNTGLNRVQGVSVWATGDIGLVRF
jgi:hypothetical protein